MNYEWNYNPPSDAELKLAGEMAEELKISPVLARVLIGRGIGSVQEARKFFRPQLTDLHDPFLFQDMQKAVNRLNEALGRKERILVYGDYDVDGCTAVALVYRFLQQFYSNIDYYIPDRNEDGYGVSRKGVDYAQETGVGLVIVLDCGIKAIEEVAYAKEKGIDFIICDHHVPGDELPPALAILNAKRFDNTYPYEHLCGCGVGFKLIQAFAISNGIEFSQLIPLLDLCAISIAADIVPIMGENRILAYHGLRQLNSSPSTGVKALMEICGLTNKEISLGDIIFKIGPRINASGRMQTGNEAVALLIEKDPIAAKELAKQIGMMMVVGLVFNPMLKNVVMRRRPYFDHEGIKCLKPVERGADIYDVSDQGYSFPSAHSMNSGIMYWGLASRIKNKVLRTVLIILPFAVGISRCILGVHYPTDVLCGWIAGALIMAVLTAVLKRLRRTWKMYLIFF